MSLGQVKLVTGMNYGQQGSSGSRYEVNKVQMVQGMSQQGSIGIRFRAVLSMIWVEKYVPLM